MNSPPTTTRRKFYLPRFSLMAMIVGVTIFCALCGVIRWATYYDEARDVTAEVATLRFQKAWKPIRIPSTASHVNMHTSYNSDGGDFAISEADFLAWCSVSGFTVQKQESLPPSPPLSLDIGPQGIRRAYSHKKLRSNGGGWIVIYDIDRHRAWFHVSPR